MTDASNIPDAPPVNDAESVEVAKDALSSMKAMGRADLGAIAALLAGKATATTERLRLRKLQSEDGDAPPPRRSVSSETPAAAEGRHLVAKGLKERLDGAAQPPPKPKPVDPDQGGTKPPRKPTDPE